MYQRTSHLNNQLLLPSDFFLPFGNKLNEDNRWVKLAQLIPWAYAEAEYGAHFNNTLRGKEALGIRMALGALIIQERMQLTDRETVQSIVENPYLQYFIGLTGFIMKPPFHHSMMTHFRKRLAPILHGLNEIVVMEGLNEIEHDEDYPSHGGTHSPQAKRSNHKDGAPPEQVAWFPESTDGSTEEGVPSSEAANLPTSDDARTGPPASTEGTSHPEREEFSRPGPTDEQPNHGTLLVDATCAPADMAYPTDLNLLNEAREKLEAIIDALHAPDVGKRIKPRTYREKARKQYRVMSKRRCPGKKAIRKAIGHQLGFVKRDLTIIAEQIQQQPLTWLNRKAYRDLLVISELYRQQREMYKRRIHHVDDRIVSIHQPHVRPIVRGKAKARVEFGAKIAVSMVDGFALTERLSWDNFNEGTTLIATIERYRDRMGFYPAVVQADQIYRNRENRKFCKTHGIRMSGPKLGRPSKEGDTAEDRRLTKADAGERNAIEGKFGEGKRKYGLGHIRARLAITSESVIHLQMLVMNLERRMRVLFVLFFIRIGSTVSPFDGRHSVSAARRLPLLALMTLRVA